MRLEIASPKAIRYALMNFHYAKRIPICQCSYSVFNEANEWCGVICYSIGANNGLGNPYGLSGGQCCELVRVALNGKQKNVSMVISKSIALLKKSNPLIELIVSFADSEQGHVGVIYQASNWLFCGESIPANEYLYNGKRYHGRAFRKIHGSHLNFMNKGLEIVIGSAKLRYAYPISKRMKLLFNTLSKPYPKKSAVEA